MTTVVNTPASSQESGSGVGFLMGIILLFVFLFLIWYYGLPMLRGATQTQTSPTINVPEQVDVNVNGGTQPTQ
jgi:hypothetical protein